MNTLAYMAISGAILLVLAVLAAWLLRNRSAALRHVIWLMALVGLLILPGFCLLGPRWRLAVMPVKPVEISAPPTARMDRVPPMAPKMIVASGARSHDISQAQPARLSKTIRQSPRPRRGSSPRYFPDTTSISQWIVAAWLIGTLFLFAKLLLGFILAARLRKNATLIENHPWNTLARHLADHLGIAHPVQLLATQDSTMPMAMGLFRPAILLPAEAQNWTDEKLRMVLLHELAHVRRRDCLTSAIAHLGFALHWFNPLAWLAMRRLVIERERACDDVVLAVAILPENVRGYDPTKPVFNSWCLLMPNGDWLGSNLLARYAPIDEFPLPMGSYTVEADYGNEGVVTKTFSVEPGKGALQIKINAPHAH